ncbi:MAG: patatin-like phospholipase family protein [Casimicrobiaceae bacterium]
MTFDRRAALGTAVAAFAVAGVTTRGLAEVRNRARTPPGALTEPMVTLVLSSGGARGFAHVGVWKALERAGIKPARVVGTSAGAFVGAFIAAGKSAAEMEELALRTRDIDIVDMPEGQRRGPLQGEALERFVSNALEGRMIEQLPIPFVAVATDFRTGELVTFKRGPVGTAVRASCSIPSVFAPLKVGRAEYVDGGLVSPLPVAVARAEGSEIIVAVDVIAAPTSNAPQGVYEQVMHSIDIMSRALARAESQAADITIRPDIGHISSMDFTARAAFIQAGFIVGQRFAPVILERLSRGLPTTRARPQSG